MSKKSKGRAVSRPKHSGVKKPRGPGNPKKAPKWYQRILELERAKGEAAEPWDFDEDLSSELSEERDTRRGGHCGEHTDCDCDLDCEMEEVEAAESEASYEGPDAGHYRTLKEQREDRKLDKRKQDGEKQELLKLAASKEAEVRDAYDAFVRNNREPVGIFPIPIKSLNWQTFDLYSAEHVDHFFDEMYADVTPKTISFSYVAPERFEPFEGQPEPEATIMEAAEASEEKNEGGTGEEKQKKKRRKRKPKGENIEAQVYISEYDVECEFRPFVAPKMATGKVIKLRGWQEKDRAEVEFIGNGYLKLRVPRKFVFSGGYPGPNPPLDGPEMFEFAGVWRNEEELHSRMKQMLDWAGPGAR